MQTFTGKEYVKIAIANAFGMDKELFETRIEWVTNQTLEQLHARVEEADEPAIYYGGLLALEDAEAGKPSGFMVGLDACSSGIQLMGALSGCTVTCESTGLVDPNRRADIYTDVTLTMNAELNKKGINITPERSGVKQALMTHFYGSTMKPIEIFGEDTPELAQFYESLNDVAPGAVMVMDHLLGAWQAYADDHRWTLPDGFESVCPVMTEVDFKVEVDELEHHAFTHRVTENIGQETGLSIAANVVHSIDGMVVREMMRRCNHDVSELQYVKQSLEARIKYADWHPKEPDYSKFTSLRLASQIAAHELHPTDLSTGQAMALLEVIDNCLQFRSFPIVCVHDEFKCHPNNMNFLRWHYRRIFQELSRTNLLEDILSQIHNTNYQLPKLGKVDHLIANANYALS